MNVTLAFGHLSPLAKGVDWKPSKGCRYPQNHPANVPDGHVAIFIVEEKGQNDLPQRGQSQNHSEDI